MFSLNADIFHECVVFAYRGKQHIVRDRLGCRCPTAHGLDTFCRCGWSSIVIPQVAKIGASLLRPTFFLRAHQFLPPLLPSFLPSFLSLPLA